MSRESTGFSRWGILTSQERWTASLLAVALGAILAGGFIPTAIQFGKWVGPWLRFAPTAPWIAVFSFPALGLLFYVSLPHDRARLPKAWPQGPGHVWRISLLPLLIAFLFGWFRAVAPLSEESELRYVVLWNLVSIPLGEEWLFRGWIYDLYCRLYPGRFFTGTNPLPTAILMSSISFSLWHIQNWGTASTGLVLLQIGYTLFTGIWLGYLRWQTRGVAIPILAHSLINALSLLPGVTSRI